MSKVISEAVSVGPLLCYIIPQEDDLISFWYSAAHRIMQSIVFTVVGAAALAKAQITQVQGVPPPASLLTETKSGVLPVAPTPFAGVETEEGAITYDGPMNPGFVGLNGPAVAQTNLPATMYMATLPKTMFDPYAGSTVSGSVMAVGSANGVQFTVNFTGIPSETYGPFGK